VAVIRPESALSPKGAPIQCQLMSATGAFWSPPGVLLASSTLVRLLMQNARRHHPLLLIYTRTWELWLPANGGRYSGTQGSFREGERNSGRHTIVFIAQMTRPRTRWQLCCLPALMTMKCMHEYSNQMSRQPLQTPGFQLLAPSSWLLPPGFCLWSCHCRDVQFFASATWLHLEKWARSSLKKSTHSKKYIKHNNFRTEFPISLQKKIKP